MGEMTDEREGRNKYVNSKNSKYSDISKIFSRYEETHYSKIKIFESNRITE